jgi:hypothetical protein
MSSQIIVEAALVRKIVRPVGKRWNYTKVSVRTRGSRTPTPSTIVVGAIKRAIVRPVEISIGDKIPWAVII